MRNNQRRNFWINANWWFVRWFFHTILTASICPKDSRYTKYIACVEREREQTGWRGREKEKRTPNQPKSVCNITKTKVWRIQQQKLYGIIVILQRDLQEINASMHVALRNKNICTMKTIAIGCVVRCFFSSLVSFASIPFYRMQYANVKII